MNERKLRIFYEVARLLNMTEVAQKLFMSQPAISQTIAELEQQLGVKLFDRLGKKLYLTQEGETFMTYVRRILNLYDEALKTMKDFHALNKGSLRIGASTTIGIYLVPELIGSFLKKYEGVDVSIAVENTKMIADMIIKNEVDFAFVEGPVHSEEIVNERFCKDELVIVTHPTHPWANKGIISVCDLEKGKWILREKGSGTREVFEHILAVHEVPYSIAFQLGNTESIKKAVEAGLGVSCMSKRCISLEMKEKRLSMVKIEGVKMEREFLLIYHKDKYVTKLISTFIDFAKLAYK